MSAATAPTSAAPEFIHEAFLYADEDEYLAGTVPFIEDGLLAGEPILVAVPSPRLRLLRGELEGVDGFDPDLLRFAPMEEAGRNPAWIIPTWADFARPHTAAGRPARGIGEPIWRGRSPDELVECGRHEALLNLAFADATGFRLLCPYDTSMLDRTVIEEAHRNHPHISRPGMTTTSDAFQDEIAAWIDTPLPPVPPSVEFAPFDLAALRSTRHCAAEIAIAAGCSQSRRDDFVVAVSEAVTNSIHHGGGSGRIAFWFDGTTLLCEVRDQGRIADPLAGRIRPRVDQFNGRGLWLINQLCDLVQIRSGPDGQVLRLHMGPGRGGL